MKIRYHLEEDVGLHEEDWQPYRSPDDRVNVKSGDGIRIFTEAKKAYLFMTRVRERGGRGRKFRVKKIALG